MKVYNVNGRIEITMTYEEKAIITLIIKDAANSGEYSEDFNLHAMVEKLLNPKIIVE